MLTVNFKHLNLKLNEIILDVGCGEGRHCIHAAFHFNNLSIGVDLNQKDLNRAQEKFNSIISLNPQGSFQLLQGDATRLPFSDSSVDKIICSEVLEHVENYSLVLNEINRVLKPGGILAVSVPRAWPEKICWWLSREYHQVEGGHIRIFNGASLKQEIQSLNFSHFKTHYAHALHSPYWWLKCLCWKNQDRSRMIALYHRFLVWDLMQKPWLTRALEICLNPIMGKSLVMYFTKRRGE